MSELSVHPDRVNWRPVNEKAPLTTAGNLAGALVDRAARDPDAVAYYLREEEPGSDRITAGDLYERARVAGAVLAAGGVGRGDRIVVCLDTSAALLATLFGAALIGAVPTLVEPPITAGRKKLWLERVGHIATVAKPAALVCEAALRPAAEELFAFPVVCPPYLADGSTVDPVLDTHPEEPALIQFTSGTTSAAKGIVLSHRGLLAAADSIVRGGPWLAGDVMVSWLPLHHDMGMVGGTLTPFLHDFPSVMIRPLSFAMNPELWLRLIHRFRGTISPAPNFAYRLVASRADRMDLTGLDLSCWRSAFNGAEVVDPATLRAWQKTVGPYGFRPESMRPCYGMAELGLAATFAPADTLPRIEALSRTEMLEHGRAAPAEDEWDAQEFVSSGIPVPGVKVRVVDSDGIDLPDGRSGRVLVASDSMMTGYFGQPERTAEDLREGWLHTGDLGFLLDGELYPVGRIKDLIIVRGQNYSAEDVEEIVRGTAGVDRRVCAAFGSATDGQERVVVLWETALEPPAAAEVAAAIRARISEHLGLGAAQVVTVPPVSIPHTTSGKVKRDAARRLYLTRNQGAAT